MEKRLNILKPIICSELQPLHILISAFSNKAHSFCKIYLHYDFVIKISTICFNIFLFNVIENAVSFNTLMQCLLRCGRGGMKEDFTPVTSTMLQNVFMPRMNCLYLVFCEAVVQKENSSKSSPPPEQDTFQTQL